MEFLLNYGGFVLKLFTILIALGLFIAFLVGMIRGRRFHTSDDLEVVYLNQRLQHVAEQLKKTVLSKKEWKREQKQLKRKNKEMKKQAKKRPVIYVVDFFGDLKASQVNQLRQLISALLRVASPRQEVVLRLESAGGLVHSYGLAAAQLLRLKSHRLHLTVCVDKMAASGGYMMAAMAQKICAAPFALIGSIGVIGMVPNIHRLLKDKKVDIEQHTAGEYKRTLTVLAKNTPQGRAKFKEELTMTHRLFTALLKEHRPQLSVKKIATGEVWYGSQARKMELVDEIVTSDEYLLHKSKTSDIYLLSIKEKKNLADRLSHASETLANRFLDVLVARMAEWRFFRQ